MARNLPAPSEVQAKWKQNFGAAGAAWSAGIGRVDRAPGLDAAAAVDRYVSGVQQNAQKFARNVGSVSLQAWQAAANAAQGRLAQGAAKGSDKYLAGITKVLNAEASILPSLPARGDVEANIARSGEFQRRMHQAFM